MKAETVELIIAAQNGDEKAFEELVMANTALVKSVVRKYINRKAEYDDLYQIGCMGLVKCIKKFNTAFDVELSTYAVPMIAGEIKRFLRDDGIVKVSRSLKENAVKIERARCEFSNKNNREPTLFEIAGITGLEKEDIIMALEAKQPCVSIFESVDAKKSDLYIIDKIEDENNTVDRVVDRIVLKQMLEKLPENERKIILLRYFKDLTQTQTAKIMNISQVQVSRIENKIMKKLKNTY